MRLCLKMIAVLSASLLCFGCDKVECEAPPMENVGYSFVQSGITVEAKPDTKSFRIKVRRDTPDTDTIKVYLNRTTSTAKNGIHFKDVFGLYGTIGEFTETDNGECYRDVEIIPENITEEVTVDYYINGGMPSYNGSASNTSDVKIYKFSVRLKPAE